MQPLEPVDRHTVGLVLAAGAGTRMGLPKALVRTPDGTRWLDLAAALLRAAGCAEVIVVLGASVGQTTAADGDGGEPGWMRIVVADDWAEGMSASLRAGLAAAAETDADAVLVTLVDLPSLATEAARRVLAAAPGPSALARAVDGGRPGHPVLIGRDHWGPLAAALVGDQGARDYLREHDAIVVDVTGLGAADDVDRPAAPA